MSETASQSRARLRRSARLAAVQALYQMELTGAGASEVTRQFRAHHFGHAGEPGEYIEADEDFFEDLLAGMVDAMLSPNATFCSWGGSAQLQPDAHAGKDHPTIRHQRTRRSPVV